MFGDTETYAALKKKLDPWLDNPPDYHDVEHAYKRRGELQSERIKILRDIECIEEEITTDAENKPRSNDTRIKKLNATQQKRNLLTVIEMNLAEIENQCKRLEFMRDMFKSAIYRCKVQMDL